MEEQRSDTYWRRSKRIVGLFVLLVGSSVGAIIAQGIPEPAVLTFSSYPVVLTLLYATSALVLIGPLLILYFISKDKRELSKEFDTVRPRHWLTVIILTMISLGVYPLWYSVARYRTVSGTDKPAADQSVTQDDANNDSIEPATAEPDPTVETQSASQQPSSVPTDPSPTGGTAAEPSTADELVIFGDDTSQAEPAETATTEAHTTQVSELRQTGEELRTEAQAHIEADDYPSALEAYEEAETVYEDAVAVATENELIELIPLEQTLESIITEKREAHHRHLERQVADLRASVEQAETTARRGEFEAAQTLLEHLDAEIEITEEQAPNTEFTDIQEEVAQLRERHQTMLDGVQAQLEEPPIPEPIPDAPKMSVGYDGLSEQEPIARGGNADVKTATVTTTEPAVQLALKEPRMAGTLHTDTADRIIEEAETWAKLDDHDHIVSVVDYDSTPIPWIAMEYMDAGHLGDRAGEIDLAQALWTALAVTKGVRHAHRRGVAHLDLKPANILFRSVAEGWDVPKVTDWGLSKHLLDHSNSVEGFSPQYAAPEQFDDEYGSTDDITDIYQLGSVFYELFTGQPPFDGKPFKIIDQVKVKSPTPPSEVADVPDELDTILLTALAKSKADRYDDIVYLRDDLQSVFETVIAPEVPLFDGADSEAIGELTG